MEMTLDFESCKIIIHMGEFRQYAVFISKWTGETATLTIPELIDQLDRVAKEKKGTMG